MHMENAGLPGDRMRATSRWCALAAVAISPYLFGSADPWAYLSVCLLASCAVVVWLVSLVADPAPRLRAPALTLVLLGLPVLLWAQMRPVSPGLAERLSPVAARARAAQVEEFERAGASDFLPLDLKNSREPATISASPAATQHSLCLLVAYLGVFLVLANCLTEWQHVRALVVVLAISGFAMAVFGVLQKLSGTHNLYWFHAPRFGGTIFGPFTNRNHYAVQMNMLFGATLGLLLARPSAAGGDSGSVSEGLSWRERTASLSDSSRGRTVLLGFAAALMASSVLLSLSRGGIASLAAALGLVGAAMAVGSRAGRRSRAFWAVAALVFGLVAWLGWRPVVDRFGSLAEVARDPLGDWRTIAKRDAFRLFLSAPLFGSGFGSFQHVFSIFQSPAIQGGRWLHAHDDYVQLLAEGGVVGTGLFLIAVVLFVAHVRRRLPRASREGRMMAAGLAVAVVAAGLHSLLDYGLHKPGNAFLFAALCGMVIACAHLGEVPEAPESVRRGLRIRLAALAALACVAGLMLTGVGALRGDLAFRRFLHLGYLTPRLTEPAALDAVVRSGRMEGDLVMELGRDDPEALWTVSATFLQWSGRPELDPLLRLSVADRSVAAAALAVRAGPSGYENWLQLARAFHAIGLGQQAQNCLERARTFAPLGLEVEL